MAALRAAAERVAVFHAANMSRVNAAIAVLRTRARPPATTSRSSKCTTGTKWTRRPGPPWRWREWWLKPVEEMVERRSRYGREGAQRRDADEIGIHAIRAGGNPGEHTVILASEGEEVRLSHRAFSRASYAEGALRAARLIVDQPPGGTTRRRCRVSLIDSSITTRCGPEFPGNCYHADDSRTERRKLAVKQSREREDRPCLPGSRRFA